MIGDEQVLRLRGREQVFCLRGRDGEIIPTESIDIRDTEYLIGLASEDELGLDDVWSVPTEADQALQDAHAGSRHLYDSWRDSRDLHFSLGGACYAPLPCRR